MRIRIMTAVATSILIGLAAASSPASAKTKSQCTKEWQANKAANQAAGKTEKAYVAECRGTAAAAAKPAAATAKPEKEGGGGGRY